MKKEKTANLPEQNAPAPTKKKRGLFRTLFRWVFRLVLLLIVLLLIAGALVYRLPQKWGLVSSVAERQFAPVPDRAGAAELLEEAKAKGLNTQGVSIYVLPYKDYASSVAVVNLDAAAGFQFAGGSSLGAVGNTFVQVGGGQKAKDLNIQHVTLIYTSQKGEDIMSFAAPREQILAFANKQLTQDQFIASIEGDINLPAIIDEQMEALQNFLQ